MRNLLRIGAAAVFSLSMAGFAFSADGTAVILVAKQTVYPGDTITENMLTSRPSGQNQTVGAFATDAQSLIGKVARRTLLPGQPIPRNAIREQYVILQGKTVPLVFESGTITITGAAVALESGTVGDTISARNPDSGIVIRGAVQPDGTLRAQ
jgi:flagella basal body P-ring formation protein FlgA